MFLDDVKHIGHVVAMQTLAVFHTEMETTTFDNISVNRFVVHMFLVIPGFKSLWIVSGYTVQLFRLEVRRQVLMSEAETK